MKLLQNRSDTLIFITILLVFVIVAAGFVWRWRVNMNEWHTNFDEYSLHLDYVSSGGLGRDGRIRPIDVPDFVSVAAAASIIADETPVIVIDYYPNYERAYPLNIMAAHEIVNDTIGDLPIAVTFCPLCNSAIVYERRINGEILRLGVSGNLYGNNFLMYDDLTESWWYQFTGEAVIGDYTGEVLTIVPSQQFGFATYAARYPDGQVLIGDAERPNMNYDVSPYPGYDENGMPPLDSQDYDSRLEPMARVLASTVEGTQVAYAFDHLRDVGVVNDEVNGHSIVAIWQPGASSALSTGDSDAPDVGQAALYGRDVNTFTLTFRYDEGRIFDIETGSEWNIFGEAIAGELHGAELYDYECFSHFWFAWSSAFPNTLLYEQ